MSDVRIDGPSGFCPAQADVYVGDRYGYFRARGDAWSFELWPEGVKPDGAGGLPDSDPEWWAEGWVDNAGWLHSDTATALIRLALEQWRSGAVAGRTLTKVPAGIEVKHATWGDE